ncbi:MAG TPA: galactosyltransferase-related protein [Ramlibacter sp.]|uniref:glycosyltransferase family 2 protein n=1 Tax=Ramlibacter sp. TaxID=1917967 RepID=UPI002CD4FF99|nr:galactosyltransferase-related protein [Ramlibacter sp.]HVZ42536.1 galactosyltransferase-related protein [Ramlibacter sp.]
MTGRIAFITTCKGRLHHLRETLPTMLSERPDEVIVVDYGCPQGTAEWVRANHPDVKLVRVDDDPGFHHARARNIGAAQARADWLLFIDADVRVKPGWCAWMAQSLRRGAFYRAGSVNGVREPETFGTAICPRDAFVRIEGYDEAFRGWGGEDTDLYRRLSALGLSMQAYPADFIDVIHHGDDERMGFAEVKEKGLQFIANQAYIQAKYQLMHFRRGEHPTLKERVDLMEHVKTAVREWGTSDRTEPLVLNFRMGGDRWIPAPYRMKADVLFALTITLQDAPAAAGRD